MKKAISVLLAMILALGLGTLAMAEQAEETPAAQSSVNWDDFYIVKQPENMTVNYGEDLVFSVEVNVPAGVEVTYQWYESWYGLVYDATDSVYSFWDFDSFYGFNIPMHPLNMQGKREYYCVIAGAEKDESGNVISSRSLESAKALALANHWKSAGWLVLEFFASPFIDAILGSPNRGGGGGMYSPLFPGLFAIFVMPVLLIYLLLRLPFDIIWYYGENIYYVLGYYILGFLDA